MALASLVVVAFLLPALLPAVHAANVLVFVPMPLKSHFGGFQPMFEELARRGHNVTVVSPFPLKDRHVANYTDVAVQLPAMPELHNFNVMELINHNFITSVTGRWFFTDLLSKVMESESITKFIQSDSNSFDLVIVESFQQEYTVALGHKFNAPVINLAPATVWVSMSKWLHVPSTFSYVPDCCIGVTDNMSFVERLKNTITGIIQMYIENYFYIPKIKAVMNKYFNYKGWESRPPLEQMLSNVSLTLMNAHSAFGVCRPYLPGIIEVGGMHIREPKPLPQDLLEYIESATDGVIYFSFGTHVNLSHVPEEKMNVFLNVIGKLKQKILIKWVPNRSVKLPQNVKSGSWFPQFDILAHPNVRLFITHGGLHSVEEAVYNAKPVVGVPFFADQVTNMKIIEKHGYGKFITIIDLEEKSFGSAVEEVLSNPTFKEKASTHSQFYKDQPMKPLDRAIYWIEYVLRNGGAAHLKSDSIALNDLQFFLFDVTLALLILTGLIVWLCYRGLVKVTSKLKTN